MSVHPTRTGERTGDRAGWAHIGHRNKKGPELPGLTCKNVVRDTGIEPVSVWSAAYRAPKLCWPAICKLAAKICANTTVRHADVVEALQLSSDGPTAQLQLSHIRSGAVQGSFTVTRPAPA